jgi:hypothetical protein
MERWPRQAFATLLVSSGGALALGMAPTAAMVAWDLPLINYSAGEASEYLSCCCHASEGKSLGGCLQAQHNARSRGQGGVARDGEQRLGRGVTSGLGRLRRVSSWVPSPGGHQENGYWAAGFGPCGPQTGRKEWASWAGSRL